jgi:outer membrane protein assembly factor BamD
MKLSRHLLPFIALIILVSCSGKAVVKTPETFDAERSFAQANKMIDAKNYSEARSVLLEIKNRDLTKKYAPLAQLRIADAYVKEGEPELAVAEYRKFLEIYPDHKYAPYAQYQIAMVYFGQIESPERGHSGALQALTEFEKLKKNFPRNPYKDLIDLRIEKCRNVMADYEFLVGQFYMDKGSYQAAINRFEGLLKNFQDYKKVDTVLLNLASCYKESGHREKAVEYFSRLLKDYPRSPLASAAKKGLSSLQSAKK